MAFFGTFLIGLIAALIYKSATNRAKLNLIRFAIEKGQTLDPALIDNFMPTR